MAVRYDAIIIGAGQAGPPLAERLTKAGMTVAIVERKWFGGTCVNTGCIPTKTLVASAYAAHLARRAAEYGVTIGGTLGGASVGVDMKAVKSRKDAISGESRGNVEAWLRGMEKCRVLQGQARLVSATEVVVGDERLQSDRIFINVGGRARVPDMPGVDRVPFLTNSGILDLDVLPEHLVVVGGSYIGLEFAQIYRRFGSAVTVIELGSRLVRREDEDVSDGIRRILENEGIAIRLNAECIRFEPANGSGSGGISAHVDCGSGDPEVVGSHLLLAVGRRPNTDDLGLEQAGVELDRHGFITVDDQLRSNVPGIWAIGDCNGRGAFTHTSYNDFEIVAANLLDNDPRSRRDRIEAYALYVDPPLARVGLSETDARSSGRRVLMATRPMTRVGRAVEKGETQGFMKILVDADSEQILGASILGTGGDEAIHGILDLMYAKSPYTTLRRAVHIHPTVSELIPTLLGDLRPLA